MSRTAGAKTGLHSLLLVVKRTRSAVAKHADYCNPGLSEKKHGRASTGGWQWRTREVDVVGGYLLGDVMRERQVMRKREKRPAQQLIDATSARHSTGLAHPGIGAARWTSLPRAP